MRFAIILSPLLDQGPRCAGSLPTPALIQALNGDKAFIFLWSHDNRKAKAE